MALVRPDREPAANFAPRHGAAPSRPRPTLRCRSVPAARRPRAMTVELGRDAPDFTLKDQNGDDVTLSSFRGNENVVVVFYPFTFTGVCEGELCALRDDRSDFTAKNAQLLAISCDSRHAQ